MVSAQSQTVKGSEGRVPQPAGDYLKLAQVNQPLPDIRDIPRGEPGLVGQLDRVAQRPQPGPKGQHVRLIQPGGGRR